LRRRASTTSAWRPATPTRRPRPPVLPAPTASRPKRQRRQAEPRTRSTSSIATDVLSEGQNLQDSHVIVNYDLPWAIIRLIQRAGRVDRVGQESDTVHLYLITHDKVEQQIRLRQRIKRPTHCRRRGLRLRRAVLRRRRRDQDPRRLLQRPGHDDDDDGEGEADSVSEAWLVWSNAQDSHPAVTARVLSLPDIIHSTRDQYARESTAA
jgi:superfamily II DNA/RNA helicase